MKQTVTIKNISDTHRAVVKNDGNQLISKAIRKATAHTAIMRIGNRVFEMDTKSKAGKWEEL